MAYRYYAPIVVQNAQVGGSSGTLTDYPCLVKGTYDGTGDEPNLKDNVENTDSGGASGSVTVPADLAFYDDTSRTTQYDHEIVSFTAATGAIEAWVRIPTLNKGSDTTFYMHYGDASVTTSQENVGGTWEANFKGVWHFGEASGTRYDSSGNSNHVGDNNTVTTGTLIGTSASFELDNSEFLNIADGSQTGLDFNTATQFSTSFWCNHQSEPGASMIFSKRDGTTAYGYYCYFTGGLLVFVYSDGSSGLTVIRNTSDQTTAQTDEYFAMYIDVDGPAGGNHKIYKNGSDTADMLAAQTNSSSINNNAEDFRVGADKSGAIANYMDGEIDELRVYEGEFTADYVTTEYNNQNAPETFYSMGTEVDTGGAAPAITTGHMTTNTKFWGT